MKGRYGIHGGQYIPETLMSEIHKIEEAYEFYKNDRIQKNGKARVMALEDRFFLKI